MTAEKNTKNNYISFIKMQGIGNDFILLDGRIQDLSSFEERAHEHAVRLCNRHYGIGADGIVTIHPHHDQRIAHAKMKIWNADGSIPEMCGNVIRCVGRYLYDQGLGQTLFIDTDADVKRLEIDPESKWVTVNMGEPLFDPEKIPCTLTGSLLKQPFSYRNATLYGTVVSIGNPHLVFQVRSLEDVILEEIGPYFEHHLAFPKRINVEFMSKENEHKANVRVWERGSGETQACGTGACAVAIAGILDKTLQSPVDIHFKHGTLRIHWAGLGHPVFMSGPAEYVFTGQVYM